MTSLALLLAPSRGLGGGIERYVETVEAAFHLRGVRYRRIDLLDTASGHGLGARIRFISRVRRAVRHSPEPVRVVVAHSNLLPVVRAVSGLRAFAGATVVVHGVEAWSGRRIGRTSMMRRSDVRVVAVSDFTAGALVGVRGAAVLNPGVSPDWYHMLINSRSTARRSRDRIDLVTAFRLGDWRDKGLPTVVEAIRLLGDDRVRLTICGSGVAPPRLSAIVAAQPWCRIAANLTDTDLAACFAGADLFVLATRTRAATRTGAVTRTRVGTGASGEGYGLVLLEAQLAGTAVVAPAFGGSGDAFHPGITGLSPVDESPRALAAVLAELLADDERRREMGRAAADWSRVYAEPVAYSGRVVRTLLDDSGLSPGYSAVPVDVSRGRQSCAAYVE